MKIALAQISPEKGNIVQNIQIHREWIQKAVNEEVNLIIFPELSITGYEPTLAKTLATPPSDNRFEIFQKLSNQHQIIIGIGAPVKRGANINIGLILFHPNQPRQVYNKKYLHEDELPFFESIQNQELLIRGTKIALAICYELSIPTHFNDAYKDGAKIYLASVAKTESGVQSSSKRMQEISIAYNIPTLMVNCIGFCDNFESAGQSAVWDDKGNLLGRLSNKEQGLLIFDTKKKTDFRQLN